MTDSSPNPQLLEAARNGIVPYSLLKEAAIQSSRPAPDLVDELAYFVATQYAASKMDFAEADAVMNGLWSACVSNEFWADHDRTIPAVTHAVYLAFDAGEYSHPSDPRGTNSEIKYTKPLIAAFLAEHGATATRS